MIQSPGFSSSPDYELKLSVNKNINPNNSALKLDKNLQNFGDPDLCWSDPDLRVQNIAMKTWFIKNFCFAPHPSKIQMPLPDFVNGYGLAERVRIGAKELEVKSLSLDIMKKIKKLTYRYCKKWRKHINNKLSRQTIKLKWTYYVKHRQLLT